MHCIYLSTRRSTYICTSLHVCYSQMYVSMIKLFIYTCLHDTYTTNPIYVIYIYMYMYIFTCVYICFVDTFVSVAVQIKVRICVCVYRCMCIFMCTCRGCQESVCVCVCEFVCMAKGCMAEGL